jgi:hypothetical protein
MRGFAPERHRRPLVLPRGRSGQALSGSARRATIARLAQPADLSWKLLLPVGLFLALVTWEVPTVVPSTGFDASWQLALNLAAVHGLEFGRDVIFTYGPLGFLSEPLVVSGTTVALGFGFALVAQVALAAIVLAATARTYGRLVGPAVGFLALGLALRLSDVGVYVAFFVVVRALEAESPPRNRWLLPFCGALAAFELLVKLNGGLLCLVLFALVAWRLPPRGVRAALVLASSFALSLVVLWVATGNPPEALPRWLWRSRDVISGYTDAVALGVTGRGGELLSGALLLGAAGALVVSRLRGLARSQSVTLLLVAVAYAYAYAKEGFVRGDVHVLYFFGAFAVGLLAFAWRGPSRWVAAALVAGAAVASVATPYASLAQLYQPVADVRAALTEARDAVDSGQRSRVAAAARRLARSQLAVPTRDVRLLQGHTVDVVPYETSVVWAYELAWRPEPLLQWYTAFDGRLDRMNAAALVDRGADRILRQRTPTVDSKVAEFEAPATFLALVCHYRELAADGSWEVLARTRDRCGRRRVIGKVVGQAGKPIAVPPAPEPDDIVYARIRFPFSVWGRLQSVLFRPLHPPRIRLGGDFRFVPATASGPLVMRMPASGGLSPLFGGFNAYEWFQLEHVPSPVTVEFVAMPIRGAAHLSLPTAMPRGRIVRSTLEVHGRRYRIARGTFEGWVDIARRAGRAGVVAGWAIDPRARRPAPLVAAFVGNRLVGVTRPSESRPDVGQGLGIPTLATAGYSLAFPLPTRVPHVRLFALGGGRASELTYPAGYAWR